MLRSKMFMIVVAAAALGAGAGWACFRVIPAKVQVSVAPSATTKVAPAESVQNIVRIDGERSELRLDGKDTSLHADMAGVTLRTPFGKLDFRW